MYYSFNTHINHFLGDLITPVQLYLKLRDEFPNSLLLESSDYNSKENSHSFICCNPIANIQVQNFNVQIQYPDDTIKQFNLKDTTNDLATIFDEFIHQFSKNDTPQNSGFYGYTSYDAVQYFENLTLKTPHSDSSNIPELYYAFYQNIICFNHYYNEITFIEHLFTGKESQQPLIESKIYSPNLSTFPFQKIGSICSNLTDDQYITAVKKGKKACFRGDVFQIVPSRQFKQKFNGDDFAVYRALRSINPSPYLFYFDYGNYKIIGSSPEAQLVIKDNEAFIDPIAGTIRRTGDTLKDKELEFILATDSKENAEHVMLVDLARNDLSRNSDDVFVDNYKQIQYFSHVLHMVSRVKAKLSPTANIIKIMGDTFPAGTLTGAPKYKAMSLIDEIENQKRGIYGGSLGFIGLNGSVNTAIIIRTFLAKDNFLYLQAGAGVVAKSVEENELQEVNNKLLALMKAIDKAHEI